VFTLLRSGNVELVKYLKTKCQCDPKVGNQHGWNCLHAACLYNGVGIVRYLTSLVDPMAGNNDGWNSLHIACLMGNMEVVRYLVTEASCDPSVGNSEGWTPLHIACWSGKEVVVVFLLSECHADPNSITRGRLTPLCLANNSSTITELLLEHGAVAADIHSPSDTATMTCVGKLDEKVNIPSLILFPTPAGTINILQRVGPDYKPLLGNILLRSEDGQRIRTLEMTHSHNVDGVVYDMFQKWITEDEDCTWGALVVHLHHASLGALARDIQSALI
jgi:ankyrin repeat protein